MLEGTIQIANLEELETDNVVGFSCKSRPWPVQE